VSARDIDSAALARYVHGESDPAEVEAVERWVTADPENAKTVEMLRLAFNRVTEDAMWSGIASQLDRPLPVADAPSRAAPKFRQWGDAESVHRRRPRLVWSAVGVAAAAVIAALVIVPRTAMFRGAQPFREFVSTPGGRVTVSLRDGTQLVLGPASRLRVPADFGANARAVWLDGEARFTVVHDARHPFSVTTPRTTVHDVGTTFSVHAYAEDAAEHIAVSEGEVSVDGIALFARDLASVDGDGHLTVERNVDVSPYVDWVQGTLVFRRTPFREAAMDVARTYDLTIQFADSSLATELVTGSFGGQSADEVLRVMSQIVGAHYVRTGRTITIRRGAGPAGRHEPATAAGVRIPQAHQGRR
jgi:transmembrane sensor